MPFFACTLHRLARGLLGRAVLLWLALSMGAAIASPLVHPQAMELVCSAMGAVKVVVKTDDGVQEMGATHMDCPLCVSMGAPPPATPVLRLPQAQPLGVALQPIEAARLAAATAAPLPARGPPALH
ncbi:DUF2946 family protein [Pseudacidovorax sp. RU35E]|uniref:DUF2946 family protein n=1 Tax=Pseudacidovorax sp. RU35E TaxID=1907403 RepID=UPI000954935B|nr:DUF2946 family protein [Pseudacidovorax sp. RU35E]SIQ66817.1 hypothetical protein SAMN05880557_10512 [Pseudacidovorax sp. RU35E]